MESASIDILRETLSHRIVANWYVDIASSISCHKCQIQWRLKVKKILKLMMSWCSLIMSWGEKMFRFFLNRGVSWNSPFSILHNFKNFERERRLSIDLRQWIMALARSLAGQSAHRRSFPSFDDHFQLFIAISVSVFTDEYLRQLWNAARLASKRY